MKKFHCEYQNGAYLNETSETFAATIGNNWQKLIKAETPKEAYEKFIEEVGAYPHPVTVETSFFSDKVFDNHIEEAEKTVQQKHKSKSESDKIEGKIEEGKVTYSVSDPISVGETSESKEVPNQKELSTDEKILMELIKANKKLSNLKWLLFAIAIMIYTTFRMGL